MESETSKRVTQQDVADRAGVSRVTVSYVLNGASSSTVPISVETQDRVIRAAQELGYQPDVSAQTLRSGKSMTIGVLMPDMHNPHFWQLMEGISNVLRAEGYALLLYHSALIHSEEETALKELAKRRIDGALVMTASAALDRGTSENFSLVNKPIVQLVTEPSESPFDQVIGNYHKGMILLMDHLFELGHKRTAFVLGVADKELGRDRLTAYHESLERAGIPRNEADVLMCEPTQPGAYETAKTALTRPDRPTAIIAVNDLLALAVVKAAHDLGLSVPEDLSVAGFDDIPMCRYVSPRLTTVHRDTEANGEEAARMLLRRIREPELPRRQQEYASQRLIIGETTGPPPSSPYNVESGRDHATGKEKTIEKGGDSKGGR